MSNPLKTLQRRISNSRELVPGQVVEVVGGNILVSTTRGAQSVTRNPGDATQYRPGDQVAIAGGYLRGRRAGGRTYVL